MERQILVIFQRHLHTENNFIPFQCMVHIHIMVFALWNHRGVRIVSFSALPYRRRIGRRGTTKIRQILHTQHFSTLCKCLSEFCKRMAHATLQNFFFFLRYESSVRETLRKVAQILVTTGLYFGKWTQSQPQKKLGSRTIFSSHTFPRLRYLSKQGSVWGTLLLITLLFCRQGNTVN